MSRFGRNVRRRPARQPDYELQPPREWITAPWKFVHPGHQLELPGGRRALLVDGMLVDGTVLFAVAYPGGQRMVRISPHTDWAVEERFGGRIPPGCADAIGQIWGHVVTSAVEAVKAAEVEFGGRP